MRLSAKVFACAVLIPLAAAHAGEKLEFRSKSYQITADVEKGLAREIAQHMDLVFAEYSRRFQGFAVRNAGNQPLYVFEKQGDYLGFLGKHGIDGTGSGGMFFVQPTGSGLATFVEGQSLERMFHTLRHEGFHQFAFSRIGPNLPVWVNEGLAEYFAAAIVLDRGVKPGQVPADALHLLQRAVEGESYIPFEQLLNLSEDEWGERVRSGEGEMQYAQSWSIVHLLVQGDKRYREAFGSYLQLVAAGTDHERAFGQSFGRNSYQDFEERWKRYVAALEPSPESTAAQRLEFLGQGIGWLHERGEKPESLEQLKALLRKHQFAVTYSSGHGPVRKMDSADDENFQPPPAVKGPQTTGKQKRIEEPSIEWVPATGDLPPGLVVNGSPPGATRQGELNVPVRLVWRAGPEGEPISRIVYGTP